MGSCRLFLAACNIVFKWSTQSCCGIHDKVSPNAQCWQGIRGILSYRVKRRFLDAACSRNVHASIWK
jgi:hypothetical protein